MSEKTNKSLSQWIKNSKKLKRLIIDKEKNLYRIKEYKLPCLDFLVSKNKSDITQFLNRYKSIVARAMPLNDKNVRKYKTDIRSFEEYLSFIGDIELDYYQIILSEYVPCKYAGAIISNSNNTVIELLKGTHDELVHGISTPFTSYVDFTGKITYSKEMSRKEKNIVWKTLKTINISKGNYLKGYFEFLITTEEKLKFIDYDTEIIKD